MTQQNLEGTHISLVLLWYDLDFALYDFSDEAPVNQEFFWNQKQTF